MADNRRDFADNVFADDLPSQPMSGQLKRKHEEYDEYDEYEILQSQPKRPRYDIEQELAEEKQKSQALAQKLQAVEKQCESLNSAIQLQNQQYQSLANNHQIVWNTSQEQHRELSALQAEIANKVSLLKKQNEEFNSQKAIIVQLNQELKIAQAKQDETNKQIELLGKECNASKSEKQKLLQMNREQEIILNGLNGKLDTANSEFQKLTERNKKTNDQLLKLTQKLEEINLQNRSLGQQVMEVQAMNDQLKRQLEEEKEKNLSLTQAINNLTEELKAAQTDKVKILGESNSQMEILLKRYKKIEANVKQANDQRLAQEKALKEAFTSREGGRSNRELQSSLKLLGAPGKSSSSSSSSSSQNHGQKNTRPEKY